VGLIPDEIIGIFQWLNISVYHMALGSIQPVTEKVPWVSPEGQRRPVRTAENLPTACVDCLKILGVSASWSPKGLSRLVFVSSNRGGFRGV
jgi:hypothetical protein